MARLSLNPYKGTRDLFPHQKRVLNYINRIMSQTVESFGYENYDGPLCEELDLYRAKSGEEIVNEQLYSFTDRGKREVAIRPEMTPTVARMVAQIVKEVPLPLRWYSFPNLMRYEKPQKGRLREHWQFNCDIFGADQDFSILEIIQILDSIMKNFGAKNTQYRLLINNRELVDQFFSQTLQVTSEEAYTLYKLIDRSQKISAEALEKDLNEVGMTSEKNQIFLNYLQLDSFDKLFTFLEDLSDFDDLYQKMRTFHQTLLQLGLAETVHYSSHIVRGLDYYTGFVFELFDLHPENKRAICGGGAYANLLQIFGRDPVPGVGFGLGDVTLTHFLEGHNLLPEFSKNSIDLFFATQYDEISSLYPLVRAFRKQGLKVQLHPKKVKKKKAFALVEKIDSRFFAFVENENTFSLKNTQTKESHDFTFEQIQEAISFLAN